MDRLWLADADLDGIEVNLTFSALDENEAELICDERGWILLAEYVDLDMTEAMLQQLNQPITWH